MSFGGPVHWKLGMSAPVCPFKVAAQVSWYTPPSVLLPDDVMETDRDAIGKGKDTKLAKNEHTERGEYLNHSCNIPTAVLIMPCMFSLSMRNGDVELTVAVQVYSPESLVSTELIVAVLV